MLHSWSTNVDTHDMRLETLETHVKRLSKAAFVGAAAALGAVLILAGLRALGLWFSVPGSTCNDMCGWTKLPAPICPLAAIALGGALVAVSLTVLFGSDGPTSDEEGAHGRY
jgi:predicted transporter